MGGILPPIGPGVHRSGRNASKQSPLSANIPTPGEIIQDIEQHVLAPRRQMMQDFGARVIADYRRCVAMTGRHPVFVKRPDELRDFDLHYFVAEMARHGWKIGYQQASTSSFSVEPLDEKLR